jgi:hypothetical protein
MDLRLSIKSANRFTSNTQEVPSSLSPYIAYPLFYKRNILNSNLTLVRTVGSKLKMETVL